jgi:hypothetical protein
MKKELLQFLSFGCFGLILIGLSTVPISAQDDIALYPPIKKLSKTNNTVSTVNRRPRTETRTVKTVVTREVRNPVVRNVRTSNLSVTTQPFAEVVLIPALRTVNAPAAQKANEKGVVIFENLTPASYKVVAKLDGFKDAETKDDVKILPQKTFGIKLDLEAVTYDLKIALNIPDGEIRFARSALIRKTADGSLETRETEGYCVVKVQNKQAVIPALKEGYYNLIISSSAVEYQSLKTVVQVPDDILDDDDEGDENSQLNIYELELEKRLSTEQFNSAWTNNEWDLPTGWQLQRNLQNNGLAGVALPRSEQYRYYVDFEMMSNVTLTGANTVGFVFRAQDLQNYYLVQISGERAAEPFRVTGFVVKKGIAEQIFSISIEHFAQIIKKQFRFIIRGEKNVFKLFIEDSTTGDNREIGNMEDTFNNFKKGAVGIAGNANSRFEVVFFTVLCKGVCR